MSIPKIVDFRKFCNALPNASRAQNCHPLLSATKKPFRVAKRLFVFIYFSNRIFMQHLAYLCFSYMCVVLSSPMPSMPSTTYFLPLVSVT